MIIESRNRLLNTLTIDSVTLEYINVLLTNFCLSSDVLFFKLLLLGERLDELGDCFALLMKLALDRFRLVMLMLIMIRSAIRLVDIVTHVLGTMATCIRV